MDSWRKIKEELEDINLVTGLLALWAVGWLSFLLGMILGVWIYG